MSPQTLLDLNVPAGARNLGKPGDADRRRHRSAAAAPSREEYREFRFVDLFAGIGGFHHALAAMGGECVLACEIDEDCRRVYQTTWPDFPTDRLVADIRTITRTQDGRDQSPGAIRKVVPEHDVLCAGFPCQPFSKSGHQEGIRDKSRGTLFFDIMEIVRARTPRFLVLENVRNLAGPRHRQTWETIIESIRDAGYAVCEEPVVLSPHNLPPEAGGAPQVRDRVFILALHVGEEAEDRSMPRLVVPKPFGDLWDPQQWRVEDDILLDLSDETGNYSLRSDEVMWLDAWNAFVQGIDSEDLPGFPVWVDAFVADPHIPDGTAAWKANFLEKNARFYRAHRSFIDEWLSATWGTDRKRVEEFPKSRRKFEWQARSFQRTRESRNLWELVVQFRPSGIRVKPPTYLPALVAITQTSVVASRRRRITPEEAARLQGIPSEVFAMAGVDDATAYKQLGNAVSVGAVRFVMEALLRFAEDLSQESQAARV